MIVCSPAHDVAPGDRHILAPADLKRPFKPRIRDGANFWGLRRSVRVGLARRRYRKWRQRQRNDEHAERGKRPSPTIRVSEAYVTFAAHPAPDSQSECQSRAPLDFLVR